MSEIDVTKYFKIHRDEYNRLFAIETIGDERELIKEIRKQNEQLNRYKQAVKNIQNIAITHDMPSCLKNDCNCDICKDEITEHGKKCIRNGLRKIIQKCEEVK